MVLHRPTGRRVAIELLSGAVWATAGVVCLLYTVDTTQSSFVLVAPHVAVVLIGLCIMADAMVARLSIDEDMIEIRRLTGVSVWALSHHSEAGAKSEAAVQGWRNTLTLDARDVGYGESSEMQKPDRWLMMAMLIAVFAGSILPFTFPNEAQNRKVEWAVAIVYCAVLAITAIGIWWTGTFRVTITAICAAAMFLVYLLTAAKLADVALDYSRPVEYQVRVLRARDTVSHWGYTGSYNPFLIFHYYYLDLAPWSEQPKGASMRVRAWSTFLSFHEGDVVCLAVHSGRLGDPERGVGVCARCGQERLENDSAHRR
jgi:hypothetical protein